MARLTCALGPDNAGRALEAFLAKAAGVIDASVYEVGDAWLRALIDARKRGVVTRLVVDPRSDPEMRERAVALTQHGVEVRLLADPDSRAHAKLVAVDEEAVALGSGNLNGRDLPYQQGRRTHDLAGTREWWVLVEGVPTLARGARRHVMRNWRRGTPALGLAEPFDDEVAPPVRPDANERAPLELELSPRRLRFAGGAAGVRLMEEELIRSVRRRCLVTVPYVSAAAPAVAPLLGALTTHFRRGLDVRLLLGGPPASESDIAALLHIEAPVRMMDPEHVLTATAGHAKGLICDATVVVGSANWSEPGLTTNDEAALAMNHPDATAYYVDAFEADWALAVELPGSA